MGFINLLLIRVNSGTGDQLYLSHSLCSTHPLILKDCTVDKMDLMPSSAF